MPRGDGSGPNGLGPMTGRAVGYCSGHLVPGFMNPVFGFGFGRGGGRGLCRGFWTTGIPGWARFPGFTAAVPDDQGFYPAGGLDPATEARMLSGQIEIMEQSLKNAKERLDELQKSEG
jgi:hypothetical protein